MSRVSKLCSVCTSTRLNSDDILTCTAQHRSRGAMRLHGTGMLKESMGKANKRSFPELNTNLECGFITHSGINKKSPELRPTEKVSKLTYEGLMSMSLMVYFSLLPLRVFWKVTLPSGNSNILHHWQTFFSLPLGFKKWFFMWRFVLWCLF